MNVVKVYISHGDGGERGIGPVIGVSFTQAEAEQVSKGQGWWNGNGAVWEGHAIQDGEDLYLLERPLPFKNGVDSRKTAQIAKEKALAKLTPEDMIALGLKGD